MKKCLFFLFLSVFLILQGCTKPKEETIEKDQLKPVLIGFETMNKTFGVLSPTPDWLVGIYAYDNVDGNLTSEIEVDASKVNMNKVGIYPITYSVKDLSGNTAKETIDVIIKDLSSPIIYGFSDITIDINSTQVPRWFENVKAYDNLDGDITNELYIDDHKVKYNIPGDYQVTYESRDSNGNNTYAQITMTVKDVLGSKTNPITLNDSYIVSGYDTLYGNYKLKIQVNHSLRGTDADKLLLNELNEVEIEYLITNVTMQLIEIDVAKSYYKTHGFKNWNDFKLVSIDNKTYDNLTSIVLPNDLDECKLLISDTCTGNIISLVNKEDKLLVNYENAWFDIIEQKTVINNPAVERKDGYRYIKGIGFPYNLIKSNYADQGSINTPASIFEYEWLETISLEKTNISQNSEAKIYNASTMDELVRQLVEPRKFLQLYDFIDQNQDVSEIYENQSIYIYEHEIQKYKLTLPTFSNGLETYKDHLSSSFIRNLDNLSNGEWTYEKFFDVYGTHVIASGIYGGRLEIYCSVASKENESIQDSYCSRIFSGLTEKPDPNRVEIPNSTLLTHYTYTKRGGSTIGLYGYDNTENYSKWLNLTDDESVLVDFSENGLIPIWDLLPKSHSHLKEPMLKEYQQYEQQHISSVKN